MPENAGKPDVGAAWVCDDAITTWKHARLNSDSVSDHRGWGIYGASICVHPRDLRAILVDVPGTSFYELVVFRPLLYRGV